MSIELLTKKVKALQLYAMVMSLIILLLLAVSIFLLMRHSRFTEITAERVNIVEPDGTVKLAISSHQRQDPGRMDNKPFPKRERPAGMIFFNDEGDECGGLVYDGNKKSAGMTYSIDQYKNDQIMQLQYSQENSDTGLQRSYGLKLWDRDDAFTLTKRIQQYDSLKALTDSNAYKAGLEKMKAAGYTQQRLFVGKTQAGEVGLFLNDAHGMPRMRIFINRQNEPVIQTLNDKGDIISSR